jgi:hypothetical protein
MEHLKLSPRTWRIGSDVQPNPEDLCKCLPIEPDILDFRHIAKHVPIPVIAAQEIGVDTILSWTQDTFNPVAATVAGGTKQGEQCDHTDEKNFLQSLRPFVR